MKNDHMKHLVLVGGGHAHLFVLVRLAKQRLRELQVTLINPTRWLDYSGMLPGWLAGLYRKEECRIHVEALAIRAGAHFIEDSVVGMDASRNCVCLPDGTHIPYDVVSLDVGSETDMGWLQAMGPGVIPLRPIADFYHSWQEVIQSIERRPHLDVAVVGGGAAGVEVALAIGNYGKKSPAHVHVTLIAGTRGVLAEHNPGVQAAAANALARAGVEIINERAAGTAGALLLSNGRSIASDQVIAATGSKPALWLKLSQLALDENGYVRVDAHHRSVSHENVFAAGNVCSRVDLDLQRSGVHAVKAGPILAYNLIATLHRKSLLKYRPKRKSLYLLSCGDGRAIASWGRWSAEGKWVWRWKDNIDRNFIRRFSL